ncbi:hypothetical protein ABT008_11440 [Micromonospora sp. NPDC002389]|uniref:hypothetical protein n=1 Tax=Micromonospora sp. NPDC002389 TaxID=3154272 RepID=UPI00331BB58D
MRFRSILLATAAVLVVLHVLGLLTGVPIFRYAELMALSVLAAYALLAGVPIARWAVPLALVAPIVDAYRTMPAVYVGGAWQVLRPGPSGFNIGFDTTFRATWAALVVVLVLTVVALRRRERPRRRVMVGAALAAVVMTGFAVVLVVQVHLARRDAESLRPRESRSAVPELLAVASPPLVLALGAIALAALLVGRGYRLAAVGAALLAPAALLHLDAALGMVPLPYPGSRGSVFTEIGTTTSLPAPVPALTAAVELTAYLLLVVGLTSDRVRSSERHGPADPSPAG